MATQKPKKAALSATRINFEAELFRKKDLPTKLKSEKGRISEGVWGMQELKLDGEDFMVAFGRTWEGATDAGSAVVVKPRTKPAAKKPAVKKAVKA